MILLSSRLKRAGHLPSSFGYFVRLDSFDEIVAKWTRHVESTLARDRGDTGGSTIAPEPYAIIGHSLGNILTRYATDRLPAGLCRFIMLAPPNRPPVLARQLKQSRIYRALTGDAGQRLADPEFYEQLQRPDVPTLILAGDSGPRAPWLPFEGAPTDGVVGVEETRLGDVPHRVVPSLHTFIMNDREATRMIDHFLERGTVDDAEDSPNPPSAAAEPAS